MTSASSSFRPFAAVGFALLGLLAAGNAQAIPLCVSTPALLQNALDLGEVLGLPVEIQLVKGTYDMTSNVFGSFASHATLEGGYSANCLSRVSNAENTVIDLHGYALALSQNEASPRARLLLDGLTIANSNQQLVLSSGRPDHLSADEPGDLTLRRVRMRNIKTQVHLTAMWGTLTLENVLFDHLNSNENCAVTLVADDGALYVNHSTFALPGNSDLCLGDGDDTSSMHFANSIIWSANGSGRVVGPLHEDTTVRLVNSVFYGAFTLAEQAIINQISTAPAYVDAANGNFRLKTNPLTPAINSGTLVTPFGEPATDIAGQPRIVGHLPDRGAYESSVNNFSTLIVTNTNDNGAGSLRQAVIEANATPQDAKSIVFDIRVGPANVPLCPAVIALSTPLPSVVGLVSVEGYTQPGATINTSQNAFNAKVCVALKPAGASLAHGFRVSSTGTGASLSVRGLGFGGIAQPVMLLGGHDHVIAGNQFGGTMGGVDLPGAVFNAVSVGVAASGGVQIGGVFLADRNVIGDAEYAGVVIDASVQSTPDRCQVTNNLIGLAPNGSTALPNLFGISVDGSGCLFSRNRIAGNTSSNLWLNIGSHGNQIVQNVIGLNAQGVGIANSAIGILIEGHDNTIGAQGNGDAARANTVSAMVGGGIVVRGNAATGNSLAANLVYDNGATGNGMDFDLQDNAGVAGPTPNDAGDADTGGNTLLNAPEPTNIAMPGNQPFNRPVSVAALANVKAGTYRVDVYASASAASNGRGHAQVHLGNVSRTLANGQAAFQVDVVVPSPAPGTVISMTLTDALGNTSELGKAMALPLSVALFSDGFED